MLFPMPHYGEVHGKSTLYNQTVFEIFGLKIHGLILLPMVLNFCIHVKVLFLLTNSLSTREGFFVKDLAAVSFFQTCAIHSYS